MYKEKLNKYIENNTKLNADLNIFSGLCAYEILREKGLSEEQGIKDCSKIKVII